MMAKMILMISLVAQLVPACARSRSRRQLGEGVPLCGSGVSYLPVKGMAAVAL